MSADDVQRTERPRRVGGIAAVLIAAVVLGRPGPVRSEDAAETLHLAVGGNAIVTLQENPSTGYRWHLSPSESSELCLIEISDAGYAQGSNGDPARAAMVGVPGRHSFRIVARKAGTAVAVFDYIRDWEKQASASRHTVTVEIAGR